MKLIFYISKNYPFYFSPEDVKTAKDLVSSFLEKHIQIAHTTLKHQDCDQFFSSLQASFKRALRDKENYMQHLGKVVWLLSQAMLVKRGNAAIVKRLIRMIQLHHCKDSLPAYQFPLNIDLLAIFTPSEEQFSLLFPCIV